MKDKSSRRLGFLIIVFISIAIALTYVLTLKNQDIRPRAQTITPSPSTIAVIDPSPTNSYYALLTGQNEVPANTSTATGVTTILVSTLNNTISMNIRVQGIPLSKITGNHIHKGTPGMNGPIVYNIDADVKASAWSNSFGGSFRNVSGSTNLNSFLNDLQAGDLYLNVHSASFTEGEIRGQFQLGYPPILDPTPSPNPVSWVSNNVSIQADDFYLIANNRKFFAKVYPVYTSETSGMINSSLSYTRMDIEWFENGELMSLMLYIKKDNQKWWASSVSTSNGEVTGVPIYYPNPPLQTDPAGGSGNYFQTPLGQVFTGDVMFTAGSNNIYAGSLYFKNLRLNPSASVLASPSPTPAIVANLILNLKFEGVATSKPDQYLTFKFTNLDQTKAAPDYMFTGWYQSNTQGAYTPKNPTTDMLVVKSTYKICASHATHLVKCANSVDLSDPFATQLTLDLTSNELLAGNSVNLGTSVNKVDLYDYNNIVTNFNCVPGQPFPTSKSCNSYASDFDFDGDIDIYDYSYLTGNYGIRGD